MGSVEAVTLISYYLSADSRGLEVCGHGPGPTLPLDLHRGCAGRHGRDHPSGGLNILSKKYLQDTLFAIPTFNFDVYIN